MSHKNTFIIAAVVLLVVLGVWLGMMFGPRAEVSPYSAVYLATGDIYFGKLSWFPRPSIKNAWHLDNTLDKDNNPQSRLVPMRSALWGPADEIYLNRAQIIFSARLRADSPVAKAMADPSSIEEATSTDTNINP